LIIAPYKETKNKMEETKNKMEETKNKMEETKNKMEELVHEVCRLLSFTDACIFRRLVDWIKTLDPIDKPNFKTLIRNKIHLLICETYNGRQPSDSDIFVVKAFQDAFVNSAFNSYYINLHIVDT